MASQQQASNTPLSVRDSWQTPEWLFWWADQRFDFDFDLAASAENAKVGAFFDIDDNALSQNWYRAGANCWLNPPYSDPSPWQEKAWKEAQNGVTTVLLIPTFNGDKYWGEHVYGKASEITNIVGRVAFELPNGDGTAKPVSGNPRGSCLVVYNRRYEGHTQLSWVNRDDMKAEYKEAMK